MERKYNIVICPEYDVPLDKLKESGVEFCKEELSDFGTVGVPNYLFGVHMIVRNIPIEILIWLWHKERNGMDTVKWLKKVQNKRYLKDVLEKNFGPLCDVAIKNLGIICKTFENIYANVIKEDKEDYVVKTLNEVPTETLENLGESIYLFVEHGYLSQQDFLERKYPAAFRIVDDPKLGTVETADLLFFYKEGKYDEEQANKDVEIFCKFFEASARMLFCHKQDDDDERPHGKLS